MGVGARAVRVEEAGMTRWIPEWSAEGDEETEVAEGERLRIEGGC